MKLRGFGSIGIEPEDVIDAILLWLGHGRDFELAMQRKEEIDKFITDQNKE